MEKRVKLKLTGAVPVTATAAVSWLAACAVTRNRPMAGPLNKPALMVAESEAPAWTNDVRYRMFEP